MAKLVFSKNNTTKVKGGFTLVEVLVALAIFSFVIVIALSALIVSNSSAKRSTAIKTAIDNMQYTAELFTRHARLGSLYTCLEKNQFTATINTAMGVDCGPGATPPGQGVAFLVVDPTVVPAKTDFYAYYLYIDPFDGLGSIMRCIERDIFPGGVIIPTINFPLTQPAGDCAIITSKEININDFRLIIEGSDPNDQKQPSIKMILSGTVKTNEDSVPFYLQTFISQRQYE